MEFERVYGEFKSVFILLFIVYCLFVYLFIYLFIDRSSVVSKNFYLCVIPELKEHQAFSNDELHTIETSSSDEKINYSYFVKKEFKLAAPVLDSICNGLSGVTRFV